jgi:hypothetical protein
MSNEERRFMWNLAFSFTIAHRGAAFKAYYAIRSFITFHGIFMGPGYDLGHGSVWRKAVVESDCSEEEEESNCTSNESSSEEEESDCTSNESSSEEEEDDESDF